MVFIADYFIDSIHPEISRRGQVGRGGAFMEETFVRADHGIEGTRQFPGRYFTKYP